MDRYRAFLLHSLSLCGAAALAACSSSKVITAGNGAGDPNNPEVMLDGGIIVPAGLGIGEACDEGSPCRSGLACEAATCVPGHSVAEGEPCVIAGECEDGLQCVDRVCAPAGSGAAGSACLGDQQCASGLRCGVVGLGTQCVAEGTSDLGQDCSLSSDCFGGLTCGGAEAGCTVAPPGVPTFGLPTSPAITCAEPSQGSVTAHFEVPGAPGADPEGDFFRLPFPNDIRRRNGVLDFSGFPTPGVSPLIGFDPVQTYIDALVENESAWGAYPTVTFRFSGDLDFDTLELQWIDVTDPTAPRNGGVRWHWAGGNTSYVCDNWLSARRHNGAPLDPDRTYAVYVTTAVRDANGLPVERDAHFTVMMDDAEPTDPVLAAAWTAYAPLRAYLDAEQIDRSTVLSAAVLTTGPVRDPMDALSADAMAAPAPTASGWVKCGGGAVSPCPQAEADRACGPAAAEYDEYHALVDLPIFQQGEAPYLEDGGGIVAGAPRRTEPVCMALTVPRGTAPQGGWPLAVYGHGTGGSFRDHVRPEVAGALATASTPSGSVPMAVLGYDAVQHGPRRGASTDSPNNLFFNFKNPSAARGNPLQGAADVISIGRFAQSLVVPASATGAADAAFDPARIVYFGHSQGSMHGSLGLPYTAAYRAAVLSGNGASLMHSLVSKTEPVNIAGAVPLVLGDANRDGELRGGEMHPALSVLQHWIDPADPVHFAALIARDPIATVGPKSVLQTYGIADSFSPPVTMQTYAIAADLQLVESHDSVDVPDEISDLVAQPLPFSGNAVVLDQTVTLAIRQYQAPEGTDGHFVAFAVPGANADVVRFLAMSASGEVPQVGP